MIWIVRTMLLVALCLMAAFDINNNFVVLKSGIGALAFTWTSVALAMTSGNWSFMIMSCMCAMLSGSYNLEVRLEPDTKQRAIRNQVVEIQESIESEKNSLYTIEQITGCYNDIPVPCKSKLMENHNNITNNKIDALNYELMALKADKTIGWQEPDDIQLATDYATAFVVPFSLSFLAFGIRLSFDSKKKRTGFKPFELFSNFFLTFSNCFRRKSNQIEFESPVTARQELKSAREAIKYQERVKVYEQKWREFFRKNERDPQKNELWKEVKTEKGCTNHRHFSPWWDGLRDEEKPVCEIKKERDLKIIRATSGGQIV